MTFLFITGMTGLKHLAELLKELHQLDICKDILVVATARTDQLNKKNRLWLKQQKFHRISLRAMTENQTGRLVDSGAGTFGLQINDEARKAFIDGRDGTPEFILMCMRRLLNRDMTQVTGDIAKEIAKDNFTEAWDNTKRYIQAQQPDTEYISRHWLLFIQQK